ncbi:ABC transporter permease [Herbiconiux liangxiaofengii]|uniref:ABC transporter permease n=1 Tax=Herbiconiux liangxiaofengii TaxID=3342795 RepID=UPI0035B8938B
MSAAVTAPTTARTTLKPIPDARLSFAGVLDSERVKLSTLRSTVWAYALLVALQVGVSVLLVLTQVSGEGTTEQAASAAVLTASIGVLFNQLVISVLGVLVVTGEYSTGQIRSSFTAVPRRLPVLWAKALVFGVTSFVVGLVAVLAAYLVDWPLLQGQGVTSSITDIDVWARLVGAAGYLAMIGLVAFFIGALVRNTAGGIAAAMGLLLVVPSVLSFISAEWVTVLQQWLPGSVGQSLFLGSDVFEPWQAVLVMLGWIAVFATPAAILMRRRDA